MGWPYIPARHVLTFMGFLGTFTAFVLKTNVTMAIIDMVDFDALQSNATEKNSAENLTDTHDLEDAPTCEGYEPSRNETETSSADEKFVWDANQQGLVLAGFSYGAIVSLVGMAYLSRRFSHVRVLGLSLLTSSIFTLLSPVVAVAGGYAGLTSLRVIIGIATAATTAHLFGLVGIWSPPQERSKMISIILAGIPIGISCVMSVAGFLASSLGWKSIFYVTGAWGVCWSLAWLFLIHETPDDHPRISDEEKDHIKSSWKIRTQRTTKKIPWSKIVRCGPMYCLVGVHFCSIYGRHTIISMFPTYLKTVLNLDVKTSGLLSAVPFIASGLLLLVVGPAADFFISKGIKPIRIRKSFGGTGMTLSAVVVISLAYSGCNVALAVSMVTTAVAMDAFNAPGFKACLLEIAPQLSAVTFGISATVANCAGFLGPQITGVLRDGYGFYGWQISFWIAAALYLLGAIVFCAFGTNERQPWATPKKSRASVATVTETFN